LQEYRYLNHKSDLFIQGRGDSLADAVEAVAQGLFKSITSPESVPKNVEALVFTESGNDLQDLIINIFTRVLAEMDINSKVGTRLEVISLDTKNNTASIRLRLCDGRAKLHVKAVTYHEFSIEQEGDKETTIKVLFDI